MLFDVKLLQSSELILMLLDRWLDSLDNVIHSVGKKLSVLALASMLTSNVPCVMLFCFYYHAMHFSANARYWDRMSSVRLSVCNVGDL